VVGNRCSGGFGHQFKKLQIAVGESTLEAPISQILVVHSRRLIAAEEIDGSVVGVDVASECWNIERVEVESVPLYNGSDDRFVVLLEELVIDLVFVVIHVREEYLLRGHGCEVLEHLSLAFVDGDRQSICHIDSLREQKSKTRVRRGYE